MGLYDDLYNIYQRAVSPKPTEQMPPPLREAFNNARQRSWQTNLTENYGTYIPKETVTNVLPIRGASGYVTPFVKGHVAHVSADTPYLDILAHEAAHVGQNRNLSDMFKSSKVRGIEYPFYNEENAYPPASEILASLREKESELPAGQRIWDQKRRDAYDDTPADYVLKGVKRNHPDMSKEQIKRFVDREMFPEHSVMHETPKEFTAVPLETRNQKRGIDVASDTYKQFMRWISSK